MTFVPEVLELLDGEASFEKGSGIVAGRGMPLEIDMIAVALAGGGPEEMIEPDLIEGCHGGER